MLQERVVSNSMIDIVLGHFSSSFSFINNLYAIFLCFFCLDFFWKRANLFIFSFVSLRNFFSFQSIHHSNPNLLFYLDILLFDCQGFQTRQNQKYPGQTCSDSVLIFIYFIIDWRKVAVISVIATIITKVCILR